MRQIFLVWIYSIALLLGQTSPLQTFYSFLNQDHIVKMEIDFYQKQFDNSYRSSGSFYLIGEENYVYDSLLFQMNGTLPCWYIRRLTVIVTLPFCAAAPISPTT